MAAHLLKESLMTKKHGIRRQFTECFAMRKDVYEALCHVGKNMRNCRPQVRLLKEEIKKFNQNGTCLSIKSYVGAGGLSRFIFDNETSKHIFECKGPMGSGLACTQSGKHIAYTAGTGILVFLDLCAYLLIRIVDRYGNLGIGPIGNKNMGSIQKGGSSGALNQSDRLGSSRELDSSK